MQKKDIIIFTDGACSNNGKCTAKAGIGIHFPNSEYADVGESYSENSGTDVSVTNQRAELYAIQKAINLVISDRSINNITIYTDSLYSIKSLTEWIKNWSKNNWKGTNGKTVKNLDLIKPIYEVLENNKGRIKFIHVRSHTRKQTFEALGNDKADKLAISGCI